MPLCACLSFLPECVIGCAHAYSFPFLLCTSMNQRYKLAPWKTSYESSCQYFFISEPEDNRLMEHPAVRAPPCCSHSQWARYYRTHNYSQPLNMPCRQLDWRLLAGLLCFCRLLSLCSLGATSSCHTRIWKPMFIELNEKLRKGTEMSLKGRNTFVQFSSDKIASAANDCCPSVQLY